MEIFFLLELIEKHQHLQLYLKGKFIIQFTNHLQTITNVTKEMHLFVQQMTNVELIVLNCLGLIPRHILLKNVYM